MRLSVAFPVAWPVTHERDGRARAIVPTTSSAGPYSHGGPPDLVVDVSTIELAPSSLDDRSVARFVGAGMPSRTTLRVQQVGETKSAAGRPVTMVRAGAHDAAGILVEQRLAAIYDLGHYVGTVLVVGRDALRWNALIRSLGDVVLGAVLDWSGPPASLAEILGVDAATR